MTHIEITPNERMGRRVLGEMVGRGAFAKVYRCSPFTVAKVHAVSEQNGAWADAELRTLQAVSGLRHIVQLVDHLHYRGARVLVLEFAGVNLLAIIKARTLPEMEVRTMAQHIRLGLCSLKAAKVVHSDMKPENIMCKDHIWRIGDFGNAVSGDGPRARTYVATRWYRAPEIIRGESTVSFPIDWWGLGCIIYEATRAEPLFKANSEVAVLNLIETELGQGAAPFAPSGECIRLTITLASRKTVEVIVDRAGSVASIKDQLRHLFQNGCCQLNWKGRRPLANHETIMGLGLRQGDSIRCFPTKLGGLAGWARAATASLLVWDPPARMAAGPWPSGFTATWL